MAAILYRGSSCRIKVRLIKGPSLASLGEPTIAISQELTFLTPETHLSNDGTYIYADLTEQDTLQLVENIDTQVQAVYVNGDTVTRFPVHSITVRPTLLYNMVPTPEEQEEETELAE